MPKLYFGSRGGVYYNKSGRKVYVDKSNFGGVASSKSTKVSIDRLSVLNNKLEVLPERVLIFIYTTNGKTYIAVKNGFTDYTNQEHKWTSIYNMGNLNKRGELVGEVKRYDSVKDFITSLGKNVGILEVKKTDNQLETFPLINEMETGFYVNYQRIILQRLNVAY